jgi:hypothetical protein
LQQLERDLESAPQIHLQPLSGRAASQGIAETFWRRIAFGWPVLGFLWRESNSKNSLRPKTDHHPFSTMK